MTRLSLGLQSDEIELAGGYAAMPKVLRMGSVGADVVTLQGGLNRSPPCLPPLLVTDGIFGAKTLARVQAFQRNNGLVADGIVGPLTWGALLGGQRPAFAAYVNRVIDIGEKLSHSPSAWRLIGTPSYDALMAKLTQLKAEAMEQGYYGIDEDQGDKKQKPNPEPKPKPAPEIIKAEPQGPALAGVANVQEMLVLAFMASVAAIQAITAVAVQNPPRLPELPKFPPPVLLVAKVAGLTLSAVLQALNIKRTATELCKEKHPDRVGSCAEAIKELAEADTELRKLIVHFTGGIGQAEIKADPRHVTKQHLLRKIDEAHRRYLKSLAAVSRCLGCPAML